MTHKRSIFIATLPLILGLAACQQSAPATQATPQAQATPTAPATQTAPQTEGEVLADAVGGAAVNTVVRPAIMQPINALPGGGAISCVVSNTSTADLEAVNGASSAATNLLGDPGTVSCLTSNILRSFL